MFSFCFVTKCIFSAKFTYTVLCHPREDYSVLPEILYATVQYLKVRVKWMVGRFRHLAHPGKDSCYTKKQARPLPPPPHPSLHPLPIPSGLDEAETTSCYPREQPL